MEPDGMTKVWMRKTRTSPTITPASTSVTTRRRAENPRVRGPAEPPPSPGPASGLPASPCTLCADTCTSVRDTAVTARAVRRSRSARRDSAPLLLDLGGLAAQRAQVVQLRAADVAAGHDVDLVDDRGVHGERALDADTEAHLADGERLADAAAGAPDDDPLEHLDAGPVALDHPHVHLDGVTGAEGGDVGPQRGGVEVVQRVHGGIALRRVPQVSRAARGKIGRRCAVRPGRAVPVQAPRPPVAGRGRPAARWSS